MPQPEEAQRLIEEHITTLGEQKAQLERALAHLNGSAGSEGQDDRRGRGPGVGKGRQAAEGANAGGEPRAPRGARRGEVIADLKANPGSKAGDVVSRVGINPTTRRRSWGIWSSKALRRRKISSTRSLPASLKPLPSRPSLTPRVDDRAIAGGSPAARTDRSTDHRSPKRFVNGRSACRLLVMSTDPCGPGTKAIIDPSDVIRMRLGETWLRSAWPGSLQP
jgi:hypothetical protein